MANPGYVPAPINKLIASVTWNSFPALNIVPEYLLPEAFELNPNGNISTALPALTGVVQSPEAYVPVDLTAHIIISSPLAQLYKAQLEQNSQLGGGTLRPVAASMTPFNLVNMAIVRVNGFSASGRDAGFVVQMSGAYNVNAGLWP